MMTAQEALKFAFDTPVIPALPYLCNTCGRPVRKSRALRHMNQMHPGWLESWNAALSEAGL